MPTPTTTPTTDLAPLITPHLGEITAIRRDLHAHPEVLFTEERTSKVVQDELTRLGITFRTGMGGREPGTGYGVVAHLPATADQPGDCPPSCVGLRADMDALPIDERCEVAHRSINPGVMHACGHDGHTAILLGVARVLSKLTHRPNPVTLVFQPAEEGGAGGEKMCRDGALLGDRGDERTRGMGPKVTRMYGLHGWPSLPLGTIASRPGPLLAATDDIHITVEGTQGHAAYPHLCNDPIVAAAQIITATQSIVSRNTRPTDAAVVTFGTINAGTTHNIIPDRATMWGTVRTLDPGTRLTIKSRLSELVGSIARAMGCSARLEWEDGYPMTSNDEREAGRVMQTAENAELTDRFELVTHASMGGEDFAYYGQTVPSCFFLLGLCDGADGTHPGLHTPTFDFNDRAIPIGMEMMCLLALS